MSANPGRPRVEVRVRGGDNFLRVHTSISIVGVMSQPPTTFTRLVRCDNRVQYTSIGIQ